MFVFFVADHCAGDPCVSVPVGSSTCSNGGVSYICSCNDGYTGDGVISCTDINECDNSPCHTDATCANSVGSFTCTCNGTLVGNGIDTCEGKIAYLFNPNLI